MLPLEAQAPAPIANRIFPLAGRFSYLDFMRYSFGALIVRVSRFSICSILACLFTSASSPFLLIGPYDHLGSADSQCTPSQVNEYGGRFGWDATLLIYNLQAVNKWQYLGYQVTFVAGLLAALWAALFFKQHAPQYRVSIALRRR